MIGRRNVLKMFGMAAGPTAASASTLAGVLPCVGALAGTGSSHLGGLVGEVATNETKKNSMAAQHVLAFGVPTFMRDRLRRRARQQTTTLDADLAANRSFSLAAKIRIQTERNVERIEREFIETQHSTLAADAIAAATGLRWWW